MKTNTDEIRDAEIELLNMTQRRKTILADMDAIKHENTIAIESEWTLTAPPELSNQTKRSAAVKKLLDADDGYIILEEEYDIINKDITLMTIDLDYIKRTDRRNMSDVILPHAEFNRIANSLELIAQNTG